MAREDVNVRVSANVAEAVRLWQAMEDGPKAMGHELDALGRRGGRAGSDMASGMDKAIGKWTTFAAKLSAAKGLLDGWMAANREAMQLQDQATMSLDTLERHFTVQAGISANSMAGVRQQMLDIAKRRGVTAEDAFAMGQQMISSGFSAKEVLEGGALDAGLVSANALGATGKEFDAKSFTASLGQYLNATKQDKTAENVARLGQNLYSLFLNTNLQSGDLAELAPEATKIRSATGMDDAQILSVFSQFREVTSAAQSATAMRSGYVRLAGASGDEAMIKALDQIGLTPDDVNFRGEDFLQVQERLAKALEGAGDNRTGIAKKILGEEGLLWDTVLANQAGIAQTKQRTGWAADPNKFVTAAQTIESGHQADLNRAMVDEMGTFAATSEVTSETARKRIVEELKSRGAWMATRALALEGFDRAIGVGASVEDAVQFSTPGYAPWRALGSSAESEEYQQAVLKRTAADPYTMPKGSAGGAGGQPIDVNVRVQLQDQNGLRLPARTEVLDVGKNAAGRGR